jgi:hypothetical protein
VVGYPLLYVPRLVWVSIPVLRLSGYAADRPRHVEGRAVKLTAVIPTVEERAVKVTVVIPAKAGIQAVYEVNLAIPRAVSLFSDIDISTVFHGFPPSRTIVRYMSIIINHRLDM